MVVTPDRGDIVWITFDPSLGREQQGTRPAVVLSPKNYNERSSLIVACPLTTKVKGYPFEVSCNYNNKQSAILVDQIKSMDWQKRVISIDGKIDNHVIDEVKSKLKALLELK